jgi:hypothetical protein
MTYTCPVCFFPKLPYPACDYHICPCCGTEFGNDDADFSYEQLREMWIAGGANWFFGRPPEGWNPWLQFIQAGFARCLPRVVIDVRVKADATAEPVGIRNWTRDPVASAA